MNKVDFYNLLKATPKAELHLHEEAVIGENTIRRLYKENLGKDITDEELSTLFSYNDLPGFLDCFIEVQKLFVKTSDLALVFNDLGQYIKDNNIVNCETFFSPTSHLKKGFSFTEMSDILTEGTKKLEENTGCRVRILVDVSRTFGLENAMHNLDLVLAAHNPYIIGIGLGGDEEKGPAKDYAPVFEKAWKAGLHVVAHAGETVESYSMKDSVKYLHAERIGHGLTAGYDPEYMKELAQTRLPLEVCPTSNTFTGKYVKNIKEHPIKKLYDAGINVTVNTDDPTFFKVSLIDEYWNIYSNLGFSIEDIRTLIRNSFFASFATPKEKEAWCAKLDTVWNAWFKAHPDAKN